MAIIIIQNYFFICGGFKFICLFVFMEAFTEGGLSIPLGIYIASIFVFSLCLNWEIGLWAQTSSTPLGELI